ADAARGAASTCRQGQQRGGHRAQPGRDQDRRLDHRHGPRGRCSRGRGCCGRVTGGRQQGQGESHGGLPPQGARVSTQLTLESLRPRFASQYQLERELGRGGMGVVFLARELSLDRMVALKVLPPLLADSAEIRERFLREARTAAQLSHPNIVPIFRADWMDGLAYFAMGYVDGETLAERLVSRGTLPVGEAVRILREVAWALA